MSAGVPPRGQNAPIGRELEFKRACDLAESCSLIVVYGLPGIGKSWFAQRFAECWPLVVGADAVKHPDAPALMCDAAEQLTVDRQDKLAEELDDRDAAWLIDAAEELPHECTVALAELAGRFERARMIITSRRKLALPGDRVGAIRLRGLTPRKSREVAGAEATRLAWDGRLVARAHEITAGRPWLAEVMIDPAAAWARDPIANAIDALTSEDQFQLAKLIVLGTSSNLGPNTENSRLISDFFVEGAVGCYQLSREVEAILRTRDDWVFDRALDLAAQAVRRGRELSGRVLAAATAAARARGDEDLVSLFESAGEAYAGGSAVVPTITDADVPQLRWLYLERDDKSERAQLRRGIAPESGYLADMCAPLRGVDAVPELPAESDPELASAAALALSARLVFTGETVGAATVRGLARNAGPASPEGAVLQIVAALAADDPHALERLIDSLDDVPASTTEVTDFARAAAELNAGDFAIAAEHLDTLVSAWQSRGEKWLAWLGTALRIWALYGHGRATLAESLSREMLADAGGTGWSSLDAWAAAVLAARELVPSDLAKVCAAAPLAPLQAVPIARLASLTSVDAAELEGWCRNRGESWRLARDRTLLALAHLSGGEKAALPIVDRLFGQVESTPAASADPELRQLLTLARASFARQNGEFERGAELIAAASDTVEPTGLAGIALSAAVRGDFDANAASKLLSRLGLDDAPRVLLSHRGRERLLARAKAIEIAAECDMAVDVEADEIWAGAERTRGRPMACLLLARLIRADGAAVTPEAMFHTLRGIEYHPLDHRNTLYVTVSRVRKLLDKMLPKRTVIETVSGGWRLAADLDACVMSPPQ